VEIAIAFEDEFVVKGNEDASCTEDSFATMVAGFIQWKEECVASAGNLWAMSASLGRKRVTHFMCGRIMVLWSGSSTNDGDADW
jgi:hypothetical protein